MYIDVDGSTTNADVIPPHDGYWDLKFHSYTIPSSTDTTYACQSLRLNDITSSSGETGLTSDKHIIAFSPLIDAAASIHVHHIVVSKCSNSSWWRDKNTPTVCGSHDCAGVIYTWAVGGGNIILPTAAGFRAGLDASELDYLNIEIHYDNPSLVANVVDTSGFRAYYTNTLRPNDAGSLWVGDPRVQLGNSGSSNPYTVGPVAALTTEAHRQATCPT